MTYRIIVKRLDGSEIQKDVSWNLDVSKICKFYEDQKFISVEFVKPVFNKISGDLEEVIYKEVEPK
jgi:hypothetical protein